MIYYYSTPSGSEVDFYLPEEGDLIQVVENMEQPAVREREVRALAEAMQALELSRGLILTDSETDPIQVERGRIEILSTASWLLGH